MVISFARTRLKLTIRDQFVSHIGMDHFVLEGGEGRTGELFTFLRSLFSASKKKVRKDATFFFIRIQKGVPQSQNEITTLLLFAFICNSHCRTV